MLKNESGLSYKIAVVVPAYNVENHISSVIKSIPDFVDHIIVIDDSSTDNTSIEIEKNKQKRLFHITHQKNKGVGGAVLTGYKKAFDLDADIFVKMDGDEQMNPDYIESLIKPIINLEADYSKGNRFLHFNELQRMPLVRRIGNMGLSFLTKISSGYWNIFDPTNGFTAIHKDVYELLDKDSISQDYYFETSMLFELQKIRAFVQDIPIPAKYEGQQSHLSPIKSLLVFPIKLFKGFLKRIKMKYFLYDFSAGSVYISLGVPAILFGFIWGIVNWVKSNRTGLVASTGTVLIAVLPIIIGVQFITQAISLDINGVPTASIRRK